MGIYVNGLITYGILLTEDEIYEMTKDCEEGEHEIFENLFYSWGDNIAPYDGLSNVYFGAYDYPNWCIATKYLYSDDWKGSEIDPDFLLLDYQKDIDKLDLLNKFCEEFNLQFKPKWYFGGHYG